MHLRSLLFAGAALLPVAAHAEPPKATVTPIAYEDQALAKAEVPGGKTLDLTLGIGSGAFADPGSAGRAIWTISDRGPNVDCGEAEEVLGISTEKACAGDKKAKMFPAPDFVPSIYRLAIAGGKATIAETIPLKGTDGRLLSGLSNPLKATTTEGAYGLDGKALTETPNGFDTESLVHLPDGSFFVSDEYGASISHVAADGRVLKRYVPKGLEADYAGADYPVAGSLPALVMKRKLNRGIESIALAPDGKTVYFILQSPLVNPDEETYKASRTVRLYAFDIASEAVTAEYAYEVDEAAAFGKDNARKAQKQSDVKVSEMAALGPDQLLVLERISKTTKLYRVDLKDAAKLPARFDSAETSPSLEALKPAELAGKGVAALKKELVFDSDTAKDMPEKIEGVAVVDPKTLILVTDNDFGIAGDRTRLVKVEFDRPLAE
ncbi:hypothetical protein GCM10011390_13940 [Aureimonas endophytica]|uniref:Phytase-like domain-containing protein n=1 Tax=Aureimonas endophytica TaxID=2027858 RepID=A0A917E2E7_9HYPH|nr:esterase-like activity of phytase family protein [Aureimonas endophytica]GGD96374.1 hypothetical protein GCM10011390_13940 [Aureimonas endophytica]